MIGKCEVCGVEDAHACVASTLGPFSFATCIPCLDRNAEPLWAVEYVAYEVAHWGEVKPLILTLNTWRDGRYIPITEVGPRLLT